MTTNHTPTNNCVDLIDGIADIDGVCTVNGSTCADINGMFPCSCTKYYSQIRTSYAIAPLYIQTLVNSGTPNSCTGPGACEDATSFATSLVTYGGGMVPQPYYSGQVPPVECSDGCDVEATRVRILFWPVDDNSTTQQNVTDTAEVLPYSTISDGFTL